MISVNGLTKVYDKQVAVDHLDFEVKTGEILGFLGPNGAGKSTTMKMLTCFLTPTEGNAVIDGYDIQEHPLEVRKKVGYLPENNPLYLDMYVHEFLALVGNIYQINRKQLKSRIAEVVERTGLGREQHKKIGMLSKGYRQRVGLSQALLHDPSVLILDEPTSGLDPNQIVDIRDLVREVGKDKTVIFSSHILSEVETVADRVIIIDQGKLVADQPIEYVRGLAQDEILLILELDSTGFQYEKILDWKGVKNVEEHSSNLFHIHTSTEVDLRKELFQECVRQDQIIIGLQKQVFTLEDAFRKLTGSASGA